MLAAGRAHGAGGGEGRLNTAALLRGKASVGSAATPGKSAAGCRAKAGDKCSSSSGSAKRAGMHGSKRTAGCRRERAQSGAGLSPSAHVRPGAYGANLRWQMLQDTAQAPYAKCTALDGAMQYGAGGGKSTAAAYGGVMQRHARARQSACMSGSGDGARLISSMHQQGLRLSPAANSRKEQRKAEGS